MDSDGREVGGVVDAGPHLPSSVGARHDDDDDDDDDNEGGLWLVTRPFCFSIGRQCCQ